MMNASKECCIHQQFEVEDLTSFFNILNITKHCFDRNTSKKAQWNYIFEILMHRNETFTECGVSKKVDDSNMTNMIFLAIWLVMMVLTILCNLLLICSILKSSLKRNNSNLFILSLAFSDLCVGCCVLPFKVNSAINEMRFSSSLLWCRFYITVDNSFFTVSITNLLVIALDRYIALSYPYRYPTMMSRKRCNFMIIFIWLYGLTWGSLSNLHWVDPSRGAIKVDQSICMVNENKIYIVFVFIVIFLLPVVFMGLIYTKVLSIARKHALTIKSLTKGLDDLPQTPTINDALISKEIISTIALCYFQTNGHQKQTFPSIAQSTFSLNTLKPLNDSLSVSSTNTIPNMPHKKTSIYVYHKILLKATKTVAFVYGTFVIAWTPVNIIAFILATCSDCLDRNTSDRHFNVLVEVLPFMSSLLNPFIYGAMNKQYRQAFKTLLKRYGLVKAKRQTSMVRSELVIAKSASPSSMLNTSNANIMFDEKSCHAG